MDLGSKFDALRAKINDWRDEGRMGDILTVIQIVTAILMSVTGPSVDSLSASAQVVYHAALMIGGSWFLLWAVYNVAIGGSQPARFAVRGIEQLCLLAILMGVVRFFGAEIDRLIDFIFASPRVVVEIVLAFIGVAAMFMVVMRDGRRTAHEYVVGLSALSGVAVRTVRKPVPIEDLYVASVHEAGHALLYAALPSLPDDFEVTVLKDTTETTRFEGWVSHAPVTRRVTEVTAYLRMLVYRAGIAAEKEVFGERSLGGQSDTAEWLYVASRYLGGGLGETYFRAPEGEAQIAHNRQALNALQAEQDEELAAFFKLNREVLCEFAEQIAVDGTMTSEQVTPHLARVQFTGRIAPLNAD